MNERLNRIIKFIFWNLIIVFPFIMGIVYSVITYNNWWHKLIPRYTYNYFKLPVIYKPFLCIILFFVLVFISLIIVKRNRKSISILPFYKLLIIVFFLSIIPRYSLDILYYGKILQFSDYQWVWHLALNQSPDLVRYSIFTSWANYAFILKKLYYLFGYTSNEIIHLNIILNSISCVLITTFTYRISKDKVVSFLSGLLYAFLPSAIFYNLTNNPEIMSLPFFLGGIIILDNATKEKMTLLFRISNWILAGILLGIGNAFKPVAIIIFIAFIITEIIFLSNQNRKKQILSLIVGITISLCGYYCVNSIITHLMMSEFGIPRIVSSTPHYLMQGLNTQYEGQYLNSDYENLIRDGHSEKIAKTFIYNSILADWKKNPLQVLKLFPKKTIWEWQDDLRPIWYFNVVKAILIIHKILSLT